MLTINRLSKGRLTFSSACFFGLVVSLSSCGEPPKEPVQRSRPVTAFSLKTVAPSMIESVPGVARPYRVSQLAFEVGGPIQFVSDEGSEVTGALVNEQGDYILDEEGVPVRKGSVIARIDPLRYEQALEELRLRKKSSELGLEAKSIALESVALPELDNAKAQAQAALLEAEAIKSDVKAARSALEFASATVDRNRELIKTDAISRAALEQSVAEVKTAQARLEQAKTAVQAKARAAEAAQSSVAKARGAIKVKQSEIEGSRADLATLEQKLEQAQTNLDACILRAPFDGRLTEVSVAQGAYVQPGSPVAILTLLDPMMVEVTVSEASNRQILMGSSVAVYPSASRADMANTKPLVAYVWEKGEVADAATRTFEVSLIARNQPQMAYQTPPGEEPPMTASNLFPVIYREPYQPGPLYVNREAVGQSDGQSFVYRVRGMREGDILKDATGLIYADRVVIRLGKNTAQLLNWTFMNLEDSGELKHGDLLVMDPRPGLEDGFVISNKAWTYRPGGLVRVAFDLGRLTSGFYVPVQAISELNGTTSLFLIDDNSVVERMEVEVHESWRESRRVTGKGLREGQRIVLRGVHFLADGDQVDVLSTVE